MKSFIFALSFTVLAAGLAPSTAEAKRIGGGGSAGMQRSMPSRPAAAPDALPGRPAQAAPAAPAATPPVAAPQPKRSWLGPIAGLAAGLGLAALMSHLGMGAEFGNILMLALLAMVGLVAFRWVLRKFAPAQQQPALATPQGMTFRSAGAPAALEPTHASTLPAWAPASPSADNLPAGFDSAAFERIAKMIFIRMQAANDSSDLNDLRQFTTPEMFAAIKLDLQERGTAAQQTDVVKIDAQVLDVEAHPDRQIVSVRFHGLIREDKEAAAESFDEIWHLLKPTDGSREWAIAGIQQTH